MKESSESKFNVYSGSLATETTSLFDPNLNVTGKVMMKFDDDEPQEIAVLSNHAKFTIEMQSVTESNTFLQRASSIEFKANNGKKFNLYIESTL